MKITERIATCVMVSRVWGVDPSWWIETIMNPATKEGFTRRNTPKMVDTWWKRVHDPVHMQDQRYRQQWLAEERAARAARVAALPAKARHPRGRKGKAKP